MFRDFFPGYFNARGQVTMSHPQYLAYEAAGALLDSVLKAVPAAVFQVQAPANPSALVFISM